MQNPNDKLDLTIAILNFNGVGYLRRFLPKLISLNQHPFQLLIIDNGSQDDSIEYVSANYPEIKLISLDKNYGFAEGYNLGLQDIHTKYFLILNNDVEIERRDIDILYSFLENNPDYAAAQPKIRALDKRDQFEYAGASGGFIDHLGYPFCRGRIMNDIEKDTGQYDDAVDIFWATGAALFIRSSIFHALGGFEPYFFAHQEEIDLCWRIQRAGFKIRVLPSSIAYHKGGGTLAYANPFKTYLNFRNNILTIIRNQPGIVLLRILPMRFVLDMLAMFHMLVKGEFRSAIAVIKAQGAIYLRLPKHLKVRSNIRKDIERVKGDKRTDIQGIYRKSIIFQYYFRRKRTFAEIMN